MRPIVSLLLMVGLALPTPGDTEKETAWRWVDENADAVRKLSRDIWSTAELALREQKSSAMLSAYLEQNGFRVTRGVAGLPTAFIATFGSGKPVIGIYGEYDALAGISQKPEPVRAPIVENAPGHGCGHNLIAAGTAAAAIAVKKAMETGRLKGTLRYYGTPAEEAMGGKNYMLEAGVFDDVDVLLGWHPSPDTRASFQHSKAIAEVRFKFKGRAAHASTAPHQGRSALDAVEVMNVGVNYMREHVKEDARIHYVITRGGGQPNVVPPEAESWYYIRANKHADVLEMYEWISNIAKGAALMTRTDVEIAVEDDSHEWLPNRPLAEVIDRNLHLVGPPKFTDEEKAFAQKLQESVNVSPEVALLEVIEPLPQQPLQGLFSTDVGNVTWKVPTEDLGVATYPVGVPVHSWQVVACAGMSIGQKAALIAGKALAGAAIDLLKDPKLIEAAKKDFEERKKGYNFRLLLPPGRKPPVLTANP